MHKQLLLRRSLATHCNLFVELSIFTSTMFSSTALLLLPYSLSSTMRYLDGDRGNQQEGSSSQIDLRFAL
uniref:Uncharacterized protein n=1 Tax=Arundo donax TaxID=35708 RepID=A0A0A9E068_ARUDO